ncbi:hypothetical protein BC628DRAFT_489166 [Trametes gibbosa]|nr:hypothetical protein BC628DRAFT_489166 [Trametes gibbosa]
MQRTCWSLPRCSSMLNSAPLSHPRSLARSMMLTTRQLCVGNSCKPLSGNVPLTVFGPGVLVHFTIHSSTSGSSTCRRGRRARTRGPHPDAHQGGKCPFSRHKRRHRGCVGSICLIVTLLRCGVYIRKVGNFRTDIGFRALRQDPKGDVVSVRRVHLRGPPSTVCPDSTVGSNVVGAHAPARGGRTTPKYQKPA